MRLALLLGGWVAGWLLLWRLPLLGNQRHQSFLRHATISEPRPSIAVIIPARNEAANIAALVRQLHHQRITPDEIVVVDDDSSDDTARQARRAGARVITAGTLPPGWTGKSWACHVGSRSTQAELLVFLDADLDLDPDALHCVLAEARRRRLLSVAPWHVVRRPYEWLSLVFGVVALMGTGAATIRRRHVTGAFGPMLAIWREDYEHIGGHASIGSEVVDDIALARQAAASGIDVDILGGGDLVRYRMYPDGFRSLWQGWTKNFAVGASSTPPVRLTGVIAWISSGLTAAYAAIATGGLWWLVYLAWSLQLGVFARRTGSFPVPSWLAFPVQLAFFTTVFAWSIVRVRVLGTVQWRGRVVAVRPSQPHTAHQ